VRQFEATVKADEAQIDAARLQVEFATIRSPIDGRAGARLVDVGNLVHPGAHRAGAADADTACDRKLRASAQDALPVLRLFNRRTPACSVVRDARSLRSQAVSASAAPAR